MEQKLFLQSQSHESITTVSVVFNKVQICFFENIKEVYHSLNRFQRFFQGVWLNVIYKLEQNYPQLVTVTYSIHCHFATPELYNNSSPAIKR